MHASMLEMCCALNSDNYVMSLDFTRFKVVFLLVFFSLTREQKGVFVLGDSPFMCGR